MTKIAETYVAGSVDVDGLYELREKYMEEFGIVVHQTGKKPQPKIKEESGAQKSIGKRVVTKASGLDKNDVVEKNAKVLASMQPSENADGRKVLKQRPAAAERKSDTDEGEQPKAEATPPEKDKPKPKPKATLKPNLQVISTNECHTETLGGTEEIPMARHVLCFYIGSNCLLSTSKKYVRNTKLLSAANEAIRGNT